MSLLKINALRVPWPGDPSRCLRVDALTLATGRWTALVGPNGAGKSTLLGALAGATQSTDIDSAIQLEGRVLTHWPARERARRIGWLPQRRGPIEGSLSVEETVMLGRAPWLGLLQTPGPRDQEAVERALQAVDLQALRERPLQQLSGGECQRALIARVLATEAPLMLLDEPLAALDPPHQQALLGLLRVRCAEGASALVVLHDLNAALQADAVVVMHAGAALPARTPEDPSLHADLEQISAGALQVMAHPRRRGAWIALPRAD
jgi:iron complex transport system ATP-binding protein